jgi:hypothetical protein
MNVYAQQNVDFTFEEMRRCLVRGWGDLGGRTADCWREFNHRYFGAGLRPLPIFFTPTAPYGNMVGWTCVAHTMTHIALCRPDTGNAGYTADRGILLHEMLHQSLRERGDNAKHNGQAWRDAIMWLHHEITGDHIFAGRSKVAKVKQPDGRRKSVRIQEEGSLDQAVIARWPHSCGIELGPL